MFYLNKIKFGWFKQSNFGPNENVLKSNKFLPQIKQMLFNSNKSFVWIKKSLLNKLFTFIQSNLFSECSRLQMFLTRPRYYCTHFYIRIELIDVTFFPLGRVFWIESQLINSGQLIWISELTNSGFTLGQKLKYRSVSWTSGLHCWQINYLFRMRIKLLF